MTVLAKLTPGNFFRFSSSHQVNALREELERFAVAGLRHAPWCLRSLMRPRSMISANFLDLRRKCERDWGTP